MATIYRATCAVWSDSVAPRDACVVNPCFRDEGLSSDPSALATDLLTFLKAQSPGGQAQVKFYELPGVKPNYPKADKIANVGTSPQSACPRELALCLSFYATQNVKRRRGRLYIPVHWFKAGTTASLGNRPTVGDRTSVAAWASGLANLGGADVDWIVWSDKDQAARSVTNWYVDDEWDSIRSRGLRSTTRTTGTTSESGPFRQVQLAAPVAVVGDEPPSD